MKNVRLFIEIVFVLLLAAGFIGAAFQFPANPTLNQEVTGPAGQIFKWDGTKWVTPGVAMLPSNNPTFTGTLTSPETGGGGGAWSSNGLRVQRLGVGTAAPGSNGGLTVGSLATLPNTTITRLGVNRPVPNTNGVVDLSGTLRLNGIDQIARGEWTPTYRCAGGNPTTDGWTYGRWVRIGGLMWITGTMGWGVRHGGAGMAQIGGLPKPAQGWHTFIDIVTSNATVPAGTGLYNHANAPYNPQLGARLVASIPGGNSIIEIRATDFGPTGMLYGLPCENFYPSQPSGSWFSGTYEIME